MYTVTPRFWLVFILTICVLCALSGCGGSTSNNDSELAPENCTLRPTPQFVGPVLPCVQAI